MILLLGTIFGLTAGSKTIAELNVFNNSAQGLQIGAAVSFQLLSTEFIEIFVEKQQWTKSSRREKSEIHGITW